jgi:hypothetical protein
LAVDRLLAPGALRRKIVNSPILGVADHLAAVTLDDRDSSWVLHLSDILRARIFAQGGTRSSNPLSSSGESCANLKTRRSAMKIITTVMSGAVVALLSWMQSAQAQGAPQGSYLQTCTDVRVQGDALVATCRTADRREQRS